jgi:hypothetical protein
MPAKCRLTNAADNPNNYYAWCLETIASLNEYAPETKLPEWQKVQE